MTKIQAARQEYQDWCEAIGITNADHLNTILDKGYGVALINMCEARQERKYAEVADQILFRKGHASVVMLSGPSSSGKTSSSLRIAQQCRVLGLSPVTVELDNYFVNREDTPRDANGEYDFECLGAMNVERLNADLNDLLSGKEICVPKYDFKQGRTVYDESRTLRLDKGDILIMEGIHALNPALTPAVDRTRIFNVYVAPLSALNLSEMYNGSTTCKRLLRRIVRDNRTRGITPEETIIRWPSVRSGEVTNIFPYEENADVVFNSSMIYDVPLLKYYAEPLLCGISESSPAYATVQELLHHTSHFKALKPTEIAAVPPTSIMREFIGGQMLM